MVEESSVGCNRTVGAERTPESQGGWVTTLRRKEKGRRCRGLHVQNVTLGKSWRRVSILGKVLSCDARSGVVYKGQTNG